eukprot:326298_1
MQSLVKTESSHMSRSGYKRPFSNLFHSGNAFAEPLYKKLRIDNAQTLPQYEHTQLNQNPFVSTCNNRNLHSAQYDLDTLLQQIANLRTINQQQIDLLIQLILTSTNRSNSINTQQRQTINPFTDIQFNNNQHNSNVYFGKSCHQCKTKKDTNILLYCTTCRKKYCKTCLTKYYNGAEIIKLMNVKQYSDVWTCCACIGVCTCGACKRRKKKIIPYVFEKNNNYR